MTSELDEKLVSKYPKIFRDRHAEMTVTAMCWGFECNDGWYWLIDNLCGSIQGYIDSNSKRQRIKNKYARCIVELSRKFRYKLLHKENFIAKKLHKIFLLLNEKIEKRFPQETYETIAQVVASQVKEKFGGLRFYYEGGDDTVHGMVWLAEVQSYAICEECGSIKNIGKTTGWITTLCEECANSESHERKTWIKNKE